MQTRPEYPILLFSRPIMVLPCKFQTITLFCGLSCGFFAATLPWRPAAISLSCTVLNKMLLFRPALISFFSCWLHLLLSHKLSNFKCLSSLGEVLLGLHGLVPTEPIYFRHCKVYLTPLEKIFSFSVFIPRRVAEGGYCCHPGRPAVRPAVRPTVRPGVNIYSC